MRRRYYGSTETSIVCVPYKGIDIVYDEPNDKWKFTLRNQDRETKSLNLARQIIDKPVPKGKKPFERTRCITDDYGGLREVDVTSIAEACYGTVYVWTVDDEGNKRKVRSDACYTLTDKNKELWKKIKVQHAKIAAAHEEIEKLDKQLKPLRIEVEESMVRG
jgi:hypothetical protein